MANWFFYIAAAIIINYIQKWIVNFSAFGHKIPLIRSGSCYLKFYTITQCIVTILLYTMHILREERHDRRWSVVVSFRMAVSRRVSFSQVYRYDIPTKWFYHSVAATTTIIDYIRKWIKIIYIFSGITRPFWVGLLKFVHDNTMHCNNIVVHDAHPAGRKTRSTFIVAEWLLRDSFSWRGVVRVHSGRRPSGSSSKIETKRISHGHGVRVRVIPHL